MTVVNVRTTNWKCDVYIGRCEGKTYPQTLRNGERCWGNPFVVGKHGERGECVEKFRELIKTDIKAGRLSVADLAALHGKTLGCFCAPNKCHGDVLEAAAEWARNYIDTKGEIWQTSATG